MIPPCASEGSRTRAAEGSAGGSAGLPNEAEAPEPGGSPAPSGTEARSLEALVGADDAPRELVSAADAALERNARRPVVLDLRGISDATDFFLIATGDSDTHTRAIAENVRERMADDGFRPVGVEGASTGRWILLDYVNVIVHIFLPRVREFYQLERLWGDAPRALLD